MSFDVIIVGGGIIGGSIAWRLAQQRLRVLILDAGRMGGEASWAGAGMLAPGGEIEHPTPWNDFALESLRLYPDFVGELASETGQQIDFQRLGAVEIAFSEEEWTKLEARGHRQAGLGIPSCPLSGPQVAEQIPLARRDVAGALYYPQDALVDPRDVMSGLREACHGNGVEIREGIRVTEMRPRSRSVAVECGTTVLEASAAVLSAGAWSTQIAIPEQNLPPAFPVRGHLLGYHAEPGLLRPILRRGHTYLLQRSGGLIIAGGSSEDAGFDRSLNATVVSDIHARAGDILPALTEHEPDERWLGFRPGIERGNPAIGRLGGSPLWLAYGHYRNGILLAPATARKVANGIMTSSETDSSWLRGTL